MHLNNYVMGLRPLYIFSLSQRGADFIRHNLTVPALIGLPHSLHVKGPRVVVSTAAFHARVRGSVPGRGGLKEAENVSSSSTWESQYFGEPL